jgi:signal transduction histidine kinase
MNRSGSHIEGLAAFGPGVGLKLARSQLELILRHDYLDDAIRDKKPVIVPAGSKMECSGFNAVIKELNLGLFIIFPLLHYDKVEGVLILEPLDPNYSRLQKITPSLLAVTSFVASVLVATRHDLQLFEADKMKSISVLAGGLSHYLNNLFQTIFGKLSLLKAEKKFDEINSILDYCQKGLSVVKSLGDLAAPNTLDFTFFNVNDLLLENEEFFKSLLPDGWNFEIICDPDIKQIIGSKNKIQQVFLNLILNAKEATSETAQPRITITSKSVKLLSNQVDPNLPPGRYVAVCVADNGRGMSPEEIQSCFDPFFSTKKQSSQIWPGLGLATAYSIVKAHGGTVIVSSVLGQGTQVTVYLPYPLTHHLTAFPGDKLIKLICKNEKLVLELGAMLAGLGFKSVRADFENLLETDTILIDFDSINKNELRKLQALRNAKVIVVTSTQNLPNFIRQRHFKYLRKPVSIWSLANTLQ